VSFLCSCVFFVSRSSIGITPKQPAYKDCLADSEFGRQTAQYGTYMGIPSWCPRSPEDECPGSPGEQRSWLFTHARLAELSVVDVEGERSA
jgi:hypothetical protein